MEMAAAEVGADKMVVRSSSLTKKHLEIGGHDQATEQIC